jgi:hypothetical protein
MNYYTTADEWMPDRDSIEREQPPAPDPPRNFNVRTKLFDPINGAQLIATHVFQENDGLIRFVWTWEAP